WTLGTATGAILATCAVASAGLVGLMVGRFRERRFVAATFVFGVFAVGAGYTGVLGGAFSDIVLQLLAGALAPFRNIYK
ncbi:MAG: alpha-(1-_3)-arabinofuranosyltransferase family protein, partial [Solirubrobacteraceae bacterium]